MRRVRLAFFSLLVGFSPLLSFAANQNQAAASSLRIVVVQGEDAVNVIQQRTAVAPIVEVRDRNNQPVAGALVTFALQGGSNASFAGANTVVAATNALGQATAAGFAPSAAGAVQINVTAAFQGQTATALITQTNVVTAAQAAGGAATASGSGAPGTSGGGVGGKTIGTLAALGAAGAGVGLYSANKESEEDVVPAPPTMTAISVPAAAIVGTSVFPRLGTISVFGKPAETEQATLVIDYGDGTRLSFQMPSGGPPTGHVYTAPGTYTVRVTVTDHLARTASDQGTVEIKSLTGRWTAESGIGTLTLTQSGSALSGAFTLANGEACGFGLTGSISSDASVYFESFGQCAGGAALTFGGSMASGSADLILGQALFGAGQYFYPNQRLRRQ